MKLYHGSTVRIEKIDLAKSKPNKDFGQAFYLSVDEQQALELAKFRAEFEETVPLMDERGCSMQQAFDAVYTSRLFEKLNNPATGLFFQSSGYVYSFLKEELDSRL